MRDMIRLKMAPDGASDAVDLTYFFKRKSVRNLRAVTYKLTRYKAQIEQINLLPFENAFVADLFFELNREPRTPKNLAST